MRSTKRAMSAERPGCTEDNRPRSTAEVMHTVIGPTQAQKAEAAERSAKAMAERVQQDMERFACPVCGRFQFTDWPHADNGCPDAETPHPSSSDGASIAQSLSTRGDFPPATQSGHTHIPAADADGRTESRRTVQGPSVEADGAADASYNVKAVYTIPPTCICSHTLPFHDGAGRCHGTFDVIAVPCACWYFRERGRPYTLHVQPDSARIVELLERIEYNTRTR